MLLCFLFYLYLQEGNKHCNRAGVIADGFIETLDIYKSVYGECGLSESSRCEHGEVHNVPLRHVTTDWRNAC